MGSSSGDYSPPDMPTPTPGLTPTPQVQPQPPIQYPEFLPTAPGQMATGLTPAHFAAIAGMNAPPPPPPPGGGAAPMSAGQGQGGITEADLAPLWNAQPSMRSSLQKQALPLLGGDTQGDRMMLASLLARAGQRGGNAGGQRGSGGYTTSGGGYGSSAFGGNGLV
jgi:hypothetical protein